jgi:hypothetical protein
MQHEARNFTQVHDPSKALLTLIVHVDKAGSMLSRTCKGGAAPGLAHYCLPGVFHALIVSPATGQAFSAHDS